MVKKITNKSEVWKMFKDGVPQKDIAEHFGVTPVYISNLLKKLKDTMPPDSVTELTEKQQIFVRAKVEGMTNGDAAALAYDCSTKQVAKNYGSQLMQDPDIKLAVSDLLAQVGLSKRRRAEILTDHAESVDRAASLKALDIAYKLDGSYAGEQITITVDHNVRNMELKEITERMMKMGMFNKDGDIIDVTPELENIPAIQRACEEDMVKDIEPVKIPDLREITAEYEKSLKNADMPATFMSATELDIPYIPEKSNGKKPNGIN